MNIPKPLIDFLLEVGKAIIAILTETKEKKTK